MDSMGMDPWMTGLLSIFAAQNPGQAGPMLDQAGIPPPAGAMKLGGPQPLGDMIPGVTAPGTTEAPGAEIGPFTTTVNPAPTAQTQQGLQPNQLMQLAGMGGVKAPAPIQPIMNGGVTGGVKPPETAGAKVGASAPAAQMLMQALLGGGAGQNPLRVPTLGSLIGGR